MNLFSWFVRAGRVAESDQRKWRVRIFGYDPTAGRTEEGPCKGFITTRYVAAATATMAREVALSLVITDTHLAKIVRTEWGGQPVVSSEDVAELESFKGIRAPGGGYTFFDSSDEPQ